VVVGLLSLITLGLFAMFNQTQRVFRVGMTQVDVLEGGRIVSDMLTRELQQMRPSYQPNAVNFFSINAYLAAGASRTPLLQVMPGNAQPKRTNEIDNVFFLMRENQKWIGVGYIIAGANDGVGTLYRYSQELSALQPPNALFTRFDQFSTTALSPANLSQVLEGVVHFRVRAYNPAGRLIIAPINGAQDNSNVVPGFWADDVDVYQFRSNAVPATVELELGILESRTLRRAESIPDATTRRKFLEDQAGKVHIFRLRLPIRNVDPAAYS